MKRNEIKAGVVYGAERTFGNPDPVVFLQDGASATVWQENNYGELAFEPASTGQRPGKDSLYGPRGYAIVRARRGAGKSDADVLGALRELDLVAELARFRAKPRCDDNGGPASPHLEFGVLVNLTKVKGTYAGMVAGYEAQREQADRAREDSDRRFREENERGKAIVAGLAELGIKARAWPDTGRHAVRLELDEAEKLIGMLTRVGSA